MKDVNTRKTLPSRVLRTVKKATVPLKKQSETRLWGTINGNIYLKRIGSVVLFISILGIGFWIRIRGVPNLPEAQFTSNDAYLYYSQAQTISKKGYLPARDMHRWLPIGRDNEQLLPLYAYALVYTYQVISLFFSKVSLYDIQVYAPTVCFTLGFAVLLFFLLRTFGLFFATIVGVLLTTLPSNVARSAAGFSDRDAWCWMLAVLVMTSYLWKEQLPIGKRKYLITAGCGFVVFLGGLSWEAFGIFVLVLIAAEVWKFCTTDTEQHLKEYSLWVFMFVPWLYLICPAYHSGYGFSTHVATLMLVPPLVLLAFRGIRWSFLRYIRQFRPHARKLALGLTLLGVTAGGVYVVLQYDNLATTAFTLRENRVMKSITELHDPNFIFWVAKYGGVFIFGSIGIIAAAYHYWKQNAIILTIGIILLCSTIFLRIPINGWIGEVWCDRLFTAALPLTGVGFGYVATRKTEKYQDELPFLILLVWFLFWITFTRTGLRYGFFISTPLAIGTAAVLKHIATFRNPSDKPIKLFERNLHPKLITAVLVTGMLGILLLWEPAGGYATSTLRLAANRDAIPRNGNLLRAYNWIKNQLSQETTVMAAHWGNGSQLNVHAHVKTITDQDHFIPHWVHLYFRHVYCAQSEQEALYFLKTHSATHLMITSVELAALAHQNSLVGSNTEQDRHFAFYEMLSLETSPEIQYSLVPQRKEAYPKTTVNRIDIVGADLENLHISAKFEKEGSVQLPYVVFYGGKRIASELVNTERGGVVLVFDEKKVLRSSFYVPEVGWNSLSVKLFIRAKHSETFELVHTVPTYGAGTHPDIQIWKINYPENIKPHPKYLVTE